MSSYWVVEVFPLGVTAFLPIIVLPILGVITIRDTSTAYMNDTNFLFMSSMLIALAVEDCGLHRRVALKFLRYVGSKPQWLMFGFMAITSFISLWISDTATAALMAPIAFALLETIMIPRMTKKKGSFGVNEEVGIATSAAVEVLDVKRLSKRDRGICKAMMLIVAHASLIGGTGTINATGPNLIFRQTLYERYPPEETGITYLTWMAFQIPPMILYMLSSWLVVQIQFIGVDYVFRAFKQPTDEEIEEEKRTKSAVSKAYEELGPMSFAEKSCLFFFLLTIVLWITCDPKVFPGWINVFKKGYTSDALAGIFISVLMFVWPKEKPLIFQSGTGDEAYKEKILSRGALLDWTRVSQRFQWSIILLLGAGFAISRSVKMSGLAGWIACQIDTHLSHLPHVWMQVILSLIVVTMTEFSTNTSTASIFIPIAFNVAEKVGAHPLYFSIPCAIGPSFSFMLPMATSSNAIVYETKTLSVMDMASCGIFLNIFCIMFTVLNLNTWAYWLFDMNTFPKYAQRFTTNLTNSCL
ncbi:unnamed protein product, partial [Mesorhabditis belari]|uniref:Uncharacterized protein n=1 Tax=Mesorhabditis belari TaxID=2138241 RepID=A0AAF3EB34_9BILA